MIFALVAFVALVAGVALGSFVVARYLSREWSPPRAAEAARFVWVVCYRQAPETQPAVHWERHATYFDAWFQDRRVGVAYSAGVCEVDWWPAVTSFADTALAHELWHCFLRTRVACEIDGHEDAGFQAGGAVIQACDALRKAGL